MTNWLPAMSSAFRLSDHAVGSAWTGHIPFMFGIVSLLKPRLFVELGVHNGASFFAACQVAKAESIDMKCVGVDHWEGDQHAGLYDDRVFNEFVATLEANYASFASFIRDDFANAVHEFEDESIDLLHIDGFHSYDAVKNDFTTWLPKLSDRAVVLFHDINEFSRDFGVWRFWRELENEYGARALSLGNDHGLGILFVGKDSVSALGGEESFLRFVESWEVSQTLFASLSDLTKKIASLNRQHVEALLQQRQEIRSENRVAWAEVEAATNRLPIRIAIRLTNLFEALRGRASAKPTRAIKRAKQKIVG